MTLLKFSFFTFQVNKVSVTLPYTLESDLSIERSGDSVLLNTKVGMKVR